MKYKRWKVGRAELELGYNWRNWALPLSFGAACWEDPELGDYGQRYGCDYYWGFVVRVLFVVFRFTWYLDF